MPTEIAILCEEIKQRLSALKDVVVKTPKDPSISRLSSELVGRIILLVTLFKDKRSLPLELAQEIELLETQKNALFLLIECFAYVISSKRSNIGEAIQTMSIDIYDSANEGSHYIDKDTIFQTYNGILYEVLARSATIFGQAANIVKLPLSFYGETFMPWINGIESPIRKAVKRYFQKEVGSINKHKISKVEFSAKECGVQLGTKAVVNFVDGFPPITFYVKTHQNYSAISSEKSKSAGKLSGSRKGIDLKELFVYKILEYIALGAKAQFIVYQGDPATPFQKNALFIVSQDVGSSKKPEKGKFFEPINELCTYDQHMQLTGEPEFLARFKSGLATPGIAPIKIQATVLDMVARILRLRDVNEGNFGRITIKTRTEQQNKLKLIDFVIAATKQSDYKAEGETSITEGFIKGNGTLDYSGTAFLSHALMMRTREEKVGVGLAAMKMLAEGLPSFSHPAKRKMSLLAAIDKAMSEIRDYIVAPTGEGCPARGETLGINIGVALSDLEEYRAAIIYNFQCLSSGLQKIAPPQLQSSSSADVATQKSIQ